MDSSLLGNSDIVTCKVIVRSPYPLYLAASVGIRAKFCLTRGPPMARPDEEDRTCADEEPITFREFDVAVVPYFMGSDCIDGFLQWIADVDEIFDSIAIPEEKLVKMLHPI
ncbi:hypothetical protein L3X38_041579 [Prunus dulcis]|uniref:Uncharacterized protein n=1 Tax=Prunus dulcis TaxID=3755 RepID=A0AAD4UV08_PRUDU|nr:hypothetical protein L3X38_041579 [Prunus dulcis]